MSDSAQKNYLCCSSCCPIPKGTKTSLEKTKLAVDVRLSQPIKKSFVFHQPKSEYVDHTSSSDVDLGDMSATLDLPHSAHYEGTPLSSDALPTLEFSLLYDVQQNTLTVHLQHAYNLSSCTEQLGCTTSVVLYLSPNKLDVFESPVIHNSLNPEYNKVFTFPGLTGSEMVRKQTLVFRVLEHTRNARDVFGLVSVPLADADLFGISSKVEIQRIHGKAKPSQIVCGSILLSLTYKNDVIEGIVLRLANLQDSESASSIGHCIKVSLYYKHSRKTSWESTVNKQMLNPVFNEHFGFNLSNLTVDDVCLEFTILSQERFRRGAIGSVWIGSKEVEEKCRAHWKEIVATPGKAVSRWHRIVTKPISMPKSNTL